ncbi:hypothetical protein [Pseudomonas fluorescens]|uniref:hypothetical protein n=1 Tax=Pseudomonas fluorescens TaxID=294 RepID=UPI0012428736|nr:hypothetical protein [Pseudomonas fluorescens]
MGMTPGGWQIIEASWLFFLGRAAGAWSSNVAGYPRTKGAQIREGKVLYFEIEALNGISCA